MPWQPVCFYVPLCVYFSCHHFSSSVRKSGEKKICFLKIRVVCCIPPVDPWEREGQGLSTPAWSYCISWTFAESHFSFLEWRTQSPALQWLILCTFFSQPIILFSPPGPTVPHAHNTLLSSWTYRPSRPWYPSLLLDLPSLTPMVPFSPPGPTVPHAHDTLLSSWTYRPSHPWYPSLLLDLPSLTPMVSILYREDLVFSSSWPGQKLAVQRQKQG
jgi:hypothetical protein